MNSITKTITNNIYTEELLITFPFWFPILFIFCEYNFPYLSKYLFISSLFIFAETHFGSTWLFFFDRENWDWIKNNYFNLFIIPIFLGIASISIWTVNPPLILLLHYIASGWHVTKQSVGILKLYGSHSPKKQFIVYFTSFTCLTLGISNLGLLSNFSLEKFNFIILGFLIIYIYLISLGHKINNKIFKLMPLITGSFIYLPLLFFDNLAIATAVGVGMHWCQYLAIMWSTFYRKNKLRSKNQKNIIPISVIFVLFYSIIMTSLSLFGISQQNKIDVDFSAFYLIPILFQLYHFYIDGFIWKFSDPHIRKSVLSHLYS